jgi:predicted nucleotidyltransferase
MENVDDLLTHRFQQFAEEIMYLCDEKEDLEYTLREDGLDALTYNEVVRDLAAVRVNAQRVLNEWEDWKKKRLENTTDG